MKALLTAVALITGMFSTAAAEEGSIDLIEQVDPAKNRVVGDWQKSGGELKVAAATGARLVLPWEPVAEYDFEIEFTRESGSNSIALMFVAGGHQATFDIDGWGEHLAGIQNIAGQTMRDNSTRVGGIAIENGRRYTAAVRVRKDRVEAVLDGQVIATYEGDGSNLSMVNLWDLRKENVLGLGAWDSATTFHVVRVRPLSEESQPGNRPAMVSKTPAPANPPGSVPPRRESRAAQDDISSLSDEFENPATLRNWSRVFETERMGADQLSQFDINRTRSGWMTMVPHASSWYQDYRGVLVYKEVSGDFVITTRVNAMNRAQNGPPRSSYSLAGIMIRTPREVTPQTWRPGGENYIFLSLGAATRPGQFAFEVKTTINSRSNLQVTPTSTSTALIQVIRIGQDFALLKKEGSQPWTVHQRYSRPDMPETLQVGLTVYTDYSTVSRMQPPQHNTQVIRGGNPDLHASFDFVRYRRPELPADLRGRSIANPQQVNDQQLLEAFGDNAAGE